MSKKANPSSIPIIKPLAAKKGTQQKKSSNLNQVVSKSSKDTNNLVIKELSIDSIEDDHVIANKKNRESKIPIFKQGKEKNSPVKNTRSVMDKPPFSMKAVSPSANVRQVQKVPQTKNKEQIERLDTRAAALNSKKRDDEYPSRLLNKKPASRQSPSRQHEPLSARQSNAINQSKSSQQVKSARPQMTPNYRRRMNEEFEFPKNPSLTKTPSKFSEKNNNINKVVAKNDIKARNISNNKLNDKKEEFNKNSIMNERKFEDISNEDDEYSKYIENNDIKGLLSKLNEEDMANPSSNDLEKIYSMVEDNYTSHNEPKNDFEVSEDFKELLENLSDFDEDDPQEFLDKVLEYVQNWDSDVLKMNFEIYHQLTEKLITYIEHHKFSLNSDVFKAAAICVRIMPLSDKKLLSNSLDILKKYSVQNVFFSLFSECHLLQPLLRICFINEFNEMSKESASILSSISSSQQIQYELLQLDTISTIGRSISPFIRKNRFTTEYSYYLYDVLTILYILCEKTSDFSKYSKYTIPTNLLALATIYKTDLKLLNKIAKILRILLDFDENVEELECEDLSPLFMLLDSTDEETVENIIYAISSAVKISEFFIDTVANLEPPLGIPALCSKLSKGPRKSNLNVEILRSLSKLTSFKQGAQLALPMFDKISAFMDINPDSLNPGQMGSAQAEIIYSLNVLKNLAFIIPDRVAQVVDGKLRYFISIGAVPAVCDLAKALMKIPKGKMVCEEVRDVPQIAAMF